MEDYQTNIRMKIMLLGVDCCAVYNVDEHTFFLSTANMYFCATRSKTVAIKGSDSSSRCTVMLGASMAGEKAPSFHVFKGKNNCLGHIKHAPNKNIGLPE
jgi:hypothetical protein